MKNFARSLFVFASIAGSNAVTAQSETEAIFVLSDIVSQLSGTFDNEPQIFLEQAFDDGQGQLHTRAKLQAKLLDRTDNRTAEFLVYLEEIELVEIWRFSVSAKLRGVRMLRFAIDDIEAWGAATVDVPENEPIPCEHVWFQGQGNVYGQSVAEMCDEEAYEFILSEDGLWILNRTNDDGRLAPVEPRSIHTKFFRATRMECFVNILHAGQPSDAGLDGRTLINPIYLHDRGDTFEFETKEPSSRKFILKLRRSMWPSRSGRNFVPMLIIYLYQDRIAQDMIAGSAWASANSDRVAFDAGGIGARCKNAKPTAAR